MKANKQYFHLVLFSMLFEVVLTFNSSLWLTPQCATIQVKAIERYFHAVLFNYYLVINCNLNLTGLKPC